MLNCEFRDKECKCNFSYLKQCEKFVRSFIIQQLGYLRCVPDDTAKKTTKPIKKGEVNLTTNIAKLNVAFVKYQYQNPIKTKILNYNTALQYTLKDEEIQERFIIIDTRHRVKEPEKGITVIESLCDSLVEIGATVIVLHLPSHQFKFEYTL